MNRIKRTESELQNIPKNKKILAHLERDKGSYQMLYEQMLAKLGTAEVNEQIELQNKGETFKIIDPAVLPLRPTFPNRLLIMLAGIAAGIACGVGAAYLVEINDSSIRDVDILKSQLKVKMLGVIPSIITEQEIAYSSAEPMHQQQQNKADKNKRMGGPAQR